MFYFKNNFIIRKELDGKNFVSNQEKFFLKYFSSLYFKRVFLFYLKNFKKNFISHYSIFSLHFIKFFVIFLSKKFLLCNNSVFKDKVLVYRYLLELSRNLISILNFNLLSKNSKKLKLENTVYSIESLVNGFYFGFYLNLVEGATLVEGVVNGIIKKHSNKVISGFNLDYNSLYFKLILKDLLGMVLGNTNEDKKVLSEVLVSSFDSITIDYNIKYFVYFYYFLVKDSYSSFLFGFTYLNNVLNSKEFVSFQTNKLVFNFKSITSPIFVKDLSIVSDLVVNASVKKLFISYLNNLQILTTVVKVSDSKSVGFTTSRSNRWFFKTKSSSIHLKTFKSGVKIVVKSFPSSLSRVNFLHFKFYLNDLYRLYYRYNYSNLFGRRVVSYYYQFNLIESYSLLKSSTIILKNIYSFIRTDVNIYYKFLDFIFISNYGCEIDKLILNKKLVFVEKVHFNSLFNFIFSSLDLVKTSDLLKKSTLGLSSINYLKFLFNRLFFIFCSKNSFELDVLKFKFLNKVFSIDFDKLVLKLDSNSIFFTYLLYLHNNKLATTFLEKKKTLSIPVSGFGGACVGVSSYNFNLLKEIKGSSNTMYFTKNQAIKGVSFVYKSRILNLFSTILLKEGKKNKFEKVVQNLLSSLYLSSFGKNPLVLILKLFGILLNIFNVEVTTVANRENYKIKLYSTEAQLKNIIRKILVLSKDSALTVESKDVLLQKIFYSENSLLFSNKINKRVLSFEQRIFLVLIYILFNSGVIYDEYKELNRKSYRNLGFNVFSILNESSLIKGTRGKLFKRFKINSFSVNKFLFVNLESIYLKKFLNTRKSVFNSNGKKVLFFYNNFFKNFLNLNLKSSKNLSESVNLDLTNDVLLELALFNSGNSITINYLDKNRIENNIKKLGITSKNLRSISFLCVFYSIVLKYYYYYFNKIRNNNASIDFKRYFSFIQKYFITLLGSLFSFYDGGDSVLLFNKNFNRLLGKSYKNQFNFIFKRIASSTVRDFRVYRLSNFSKKKQKSLFDFYKRSNRFLLKNKLRSLVFSGRKNSYILVDNVYLSFFDHFLAF